MLQGSYAELSAAEKLQLAEVAQNPCLDMLIQIEIKLVQSTLCDMTPGPDLVLHYAVAQQRLISLKDLQYFFNLVREETTPQPEPE